ncbi:MAG: ribosome maturation factor RimP [Lachnospiraceae bacterium]|nr:ribosome maturation factor RimP [Lachnospiraceae bacterium]
MAKREEYEQKTEKLLEPILKENNFELYDVEFVKEAGTFYLRAFIDKEGGININDCELVSRRLSDLLDEKDFIPDAYILEVSSPGLGRALKKDKHFEKSIGEEVEVKLFKAIDKQKEFTGYLESFNDEVLVISDEQENELEFERSNIASVRLVVHF